MPKNTTTKPTTNQSSTSKPLAPRAGLVFFCNKDIAQELINKFKPNKEASALLALPLFQDFDEFLANSVAELCKYCTANPKLVKDIFQQNLFPYSFGFGMNHCTVQFLQKNWTTFLDSVNLQQDVLLSTVEKPSIRYGYPNLDLVGCVGFGGIEQGEDVEQASIREAREESDIDFEKSDAIKTISITDNEISSFMLAAKGKTTTFVLKAFKVAFVVKVLSSNAEEWEVVVNEKKQRLCKKMETLQ